MIIKTRNLTGTALDWAVATCEYDELAAKIIQYPQYAKFYPKVSPSTNWAQGGPIIEREIIGLDWNGIQWEARDYDTQEIMGAGHTPLVAAMRCYVASKMSNEVEIPDEVTA